MLINKVRVHLHRFIPHVVHLCMTPFRWELLRHETSEGTNIYRELQRIALNDTAQYVTEKMSNLPSVASREALMDVALSQVTLPGLHLEFGVWFAESLNHAAKRKPHQQFFGFDSFDGLPEYWHNEIGEGNFRMKRLPKVRSNVALVQGWFNDSLPEFLKKNLSEQVAFVHIDGDLYSSAVTVFENLTSRLVPGTIILFDEYFNYPGWRNGEFKAFHEFLRKSGRDYEYVGFNHRGEQVCVRLK
jgi:hypothetical protein